MGGRAGLDSITTRLKEWKRDWRDWHPSLTNVEHAVADLGSMGTSKQADECRPYKDRGILYELPLFTGSLLTCVWHAMTIMHTINGYHLSPGSKDHEAGVDVEMAAHASAIQDLAQGRHELEVARQTTGLEGMTLGNTTGRAHLGLCNHPFQQPTIQLHGWNLAFEPMHL